ncbi:MAG: YabP/YqfC family sporulation protein [Clostridia bacterium]|nr:YabP/YqfC family sporulation protein [Clostridia bacterium]
MKKGIYRFFARLSEITELPLDEMCKEFSVYVTGRREVTADGVLSIEEYGSDHIVLKVCGDRVHINGKKLVLKNYYHATLCIGGNIKTIEYEGEEF